MIHVPVPHRRTPSGDVVYYKFTLFYICVSLTIITLLLAKEFGWL